MEKNHARELLEKYNAGLCTEAEKALVERSLLEFNEHEIDLSQDRLDKLKEEVYAELPIHRREKVRLYAWASAAAAVVILILAIAHWKLEENLLLMDQPKLVQDVAPMGNRATLRIGDASVALAGDKGGVVVDGAVVKYLDGSQLEKEYNDQTSQTLSTPNGSTYQLVLQDGTKVWLNAASSISYPSSFVGAGERRVSITGEAYFEVANDKLRPFIVASRHQMIRVLGTHFNVNDYRDQGTTVTTLLEGSVRVSDAEGKGSKVMKPMEQLIAGGGVSYLKPVDVELAMAWKNGKLEFRDADIKTIMKQVARWYDLEVEYKGELGDRIFSGSVSRSSNLSVLLKILAYSDIKFTLEINGTHRKLIVEP